MSKFVSFWGMLHDYLTRLGRVFTTEVVHIGFAARFIWQILTQSKALFKRAYLVIEQIHFLGNYSLAIICVSGLFVGFVLGYLGYYTLSIYGAGDSLGVLIALILIRELGPVLTALLYAGRAGTSLTAEIGLMKSGEQLIAMEMMAVNPIGRIIAPRFWAGVIAMPILSLLFSAIGIVGGYVVGVRLIGIDEGAFWSQMQAAVNAVDEISKTLVKSFVFGLAVNFIVLFQGYEADPTPEGVARATTRGVVHSALAILALDFVLTAFMFN